MKHDLSKLHPIHRELYQQFQESQHTPDVSDELYNFYVELNQEVPDIIGKQEKNMTKEQKVRYKAMAKKYEKGITMVASYNPNAVRDFSKEK